MDSTNKFISQAVSTPVNLNSELPPVQSFAFGGIANPAQRTFLRASDREYLEARQRELDAYEKERTAYNEQLTKWQNEVYNPYKSQVEAYNTALNKYNEEVYNPYATQYSAYEKAVADWNAGPRTSDYAGPAAPTLAKQFEMTVPTQPEQFTGTAPVLPFKQEDVVKFQEEATQRAREAAGNRATAINVVSNPDQFNFGSMSVANRFMAEGGSVEKEDDSEYERTAGAIIKDFEGYGYTPEEIQELAQKVADAGRGGDELLAYLSPESMEFLKAHGGAGTINPLTGLPEFKGGILGKIGRAVSRIFGRKTAAPAAAAPAAAAPVTEPAPAAPAGPSAADLMKQLEAANAAKSAAEAKFAADLKAQQEAAAKAQQDAIAAALKADAEKRAAMVAQPVMGLSTGPSPSAPAPAAAPAPVVQDPRSVASKASTSSAITAAAPAAAALRELGSAAPLPQLNLRGTSPTPAARMPGQPAPTAGAPRTTDQGLDLSGTMERMPLISQPGIGSVGQIGTAQQNLSMPSMPTFGSNPQRLEQMRAQNPNNFFAMSQPAIEGYAPGTISAAPAQMPLYGLQNTARAMNANPNLSPVMLGGAQNAGVMTDRLGNRIYSPGAMPLFGFSKGGGVDVAGLLAEPEDEERINTNPVGTAQQFLADLSATVSPNEQATRRSMRTSPLPKGGGSARPKSAGMAIEELAKGDLGAMQDLTPKARDTDSARAQLEELARQYTLKIRAAQNKAKGLAADTFGAPTLEGPSLTKNSLAKKRFAKGGEAKKSEGGEEPSASEGLPAPGLMNATLWADTVSREMYPSEREYTKRDAARHMLAAAIMANKTSPGIAEGLGKFHEFKEAPIKTTGHWLGLSKPRSDYPTDVHNNALGAAMAGMAKDPRQLERAVREAIMRGSASGIEPGRVSLTPDDLAGLSYGDIKPGVAASQERMRKKEQQPVSRAEGSPKEGETSLKDQLIGAGETALTLGSGALSSLVGMPVGLYKGVTSGRYREGKAPEIASKEAQAFIERNTYVPRSETGRANLEALGKLMDKSKVPPVIPELMPLASIPRGAVSSQVERAGMAAEKALEKPVTRTLEKGGKSAELLKALSAEPSRVIRPTNPQFAVTPGFERTMERLSPGTSDDPKQQALDKWVNTTLKKYITRDMATENDPVRKLAEEGVTIGVMDPEYAEAASRPARRRRENVGTPTEGVATSEAAKMWEDVADASFRMNTAKMLTNRGTDASVLQNNPWLTKLDPETWVSRTGVGMAGEAEDMLKHLVDVIGDDLATGKLRPEALNKLSMTDAIKRAHAYNQDMAKRMAEARTASTTNRPVYKQYDNGYKWVQLTEPGDFATESDAMGHSVRGYEPPRGTPEWNPVAGDSGFKGYGHGGWDAIKEGRAKVFSLRDAQGNPHATAEVQVIPGSLSDWIAYGGDDFQNTVSRLMDENPGIRNNSGAFSRMLSDSPEFKRFSMENQREVVTQIKGKQNAPVAPKYQEFGQDFLRSGQWSKVNDADKVGLIQTDKGLMSKNEIIDLFESLPDNVKNTGFVQERLDNLKKGTDLDYDYYGAYEYARDTFGRGASSGN